MRFSPVSLLIMFALLFSCKQEQSDKEEERPDANSPGQEDTTGIPVSEKELETFKSKEWAVAFKYPDSLKVFEGKLPAQSPVINVYDPANSKEAPFAIHEEPTATYIAVLPTGHGVDGPGGNRMSVTEWEGSLPVSLNIDPNNSRVFLLENGEPWGFSLRFHAPPEGWNEYGSIFIHYGVTNFRAECIETATGKTKNMEECDPLSGEDEVQYYGEVKTGGKKALDAVLQSLYFQDKEEDRQPISDLIRIEQPEPYQSLSSPVKVKAEARGYWLFEAEAPVRLVDENFKVLATASLRAQGDWMTEDFVPVEAELTFSSPESSAGFLVFQRANPSGKPEKDRSFRLPVKF